MLKPNASLVFDPARDDALAEFLGGETGWVTVTAESYMSDAFYVSTDGAQVGGDHAF